MPSQIQRNLLRQSNAVLVAGSYFFELEVQLGYSLRNLIQFCNKKNTVFQLRWLLHPLPFHVFGKV
jgi:hypothetical protein